MHFGSAIVIALILRYAGGRMIWREAEYRVHLRDDV